MKFTVDWFSRNISNLNHLIGHHKGKENLKYLEVGSYEGLSTVWFLENILTHSSSTIDCFDVFSGELPDNDFSPWPDLNLNYYQDFLDNVKTFGDKVRVHKGYSYKELRKISDFGTYDFIYLDGAHTSFELIHDAILVDPLLKIGGILLFDDYEGGDPNDQDSPFFLRLALNSFMEIFKNQYDVLLINCQVGLRKKGDLHIYN